MYGPQRGQIPKQRVKRNPGKRKRVLNRESQLKLTFSELWIHGVAERVTLDDAENDGRHAVVVFFG